MKNLIAALLLLCIIPAAAQVANVRIGVSANLPIIPSVEATPVLPTYLPPASGFSSSYISVASISERYEAKPGVTITSSFDVPLSSRFNFTSGLTVSYLRYKRSVVINKLSNVDFQFDGSQDVIIGNPYSDFYGYVIGGIYGQDPSDTGNPRWDDLDPIVIKSNDKVGNTQLVNIQIPVLIGTTILKKKVGINAGAVTSVTAYGSLYKLQYPTAQETNSTQEFTSVSFGSMLTVSYNITGKLAAEFSGQHYFTPLYSQQYRATGKAKLNTLSLGITYQVRN